MREKMDGKVFISHQTRHFPFINNMIKVLFPICTLTWRVNNDISRHGKGINRINASTRGFLLLCYSNEHFVETLTISD